MDFDPAYRALHAASQGSRVVLVGMKRSQCEVQLADALRRMTQHGPLGASLRMRGNRWTLVQKDAEPDGELWQHTPDTLHRVRGVAIDQWCTLGGVELNTEQIGLLNFALRRAQPRGVIVELTDEDRFHAAIAALRRGEAIA